MLYLLQMVWILDNFLRESNNHWKLVVGHQRLWVVYIKGLLVFVFFGILNNDICVYVYLVGYFVNVPWINSLGGGVTVYYQFRTYNLISALRICYTKQRMIHFARFCWIEFRSTLTMSLTIGWMSMCCRLTFKYT